MKKAINEVIKVDYINEDDHYDEFLKEIKEHFLSKVSGGKALFKTGIENLWDIFLDNLPTEARQHYTCSNCHHFVSHFGGLVTISERGKIESAIWGGNVPEFFAKSINAMKEAVEKSEVCSVFFSKKMNLGRPETETWNHMSVQLPRIMLYRSDSEITAKQAMHIKREEFANITNSLEKFSSTNVEYGIELLKSGTLYRGSKVLANAEWFGILSDKLKDVKKSPQRNNLIWLAISNAPSGFAHISNSMLGTLLSDISEELNLESIVGNFERKMSGYMVSQSAPSQGNIAQAERIVKERGIATSLDRRFATIDEIPSFIWKDKTVVKKEIAKPTGIFGNITPKQKDKTINILNLPTTIMTWEKFKNTVLPTVDMLEALTNNAGRLMAMVTAVDKNAPNLLQWDNPFSWYYHGGINGEFKKRVENAGGRYENNEIRCSLIWQGHTDLDLHCITPSGRIIYYGNKREMNGWLDIDMNGGSHRDSSPVENIRWADNAPNGRYKFAVVNFKERTKGNTPFELQLEINGKITTCSGIATNTGYNEVIFEFDYVRGQETEVISHGNSVTSNSWNIPLDNFAKVTGITTSPNLWEERQVTHSGNHTFFLLEDCKDLSEGKGRGFFVEMLKPEYHEIRKTLEAYTSSSPVLDVENASACGLGYSSDSEWQLTLRVTSKNLTRLIVIDRMD